jgi:pyrimidine-specific ribonucleoside hydrolase
MKQIKEFIWSADGINDKKGFNYSIDKVAAKYISEQTHIPVSIVSGADILGEQFYNDTFIESIFTCGTIYGKKVAGYFSSTTAMSHPFSYTAYDEMVPLFVHYPDLFSKSLSGSVTGYTPDNLIGLRDKYLTIISRETVEPNQVIQSMPADPSFYMEDLRPYVEQIIEMYGNDEWTSGVIASELHRHLGIFAIIGVKMGIRAREYFNTGVDEFTAKSYVGSTPPLSCMNDGIQVSTGATPGHGLLIVNNDPPLSASVDFTYLDRIIRISLKPELEQQISAELKEINFIYGLDSNIYWELVRQKTLKYWLEFDRHEIFIIEELMPK